MIFFGIGMAPLADRQRRRILDGLSVMQQADTLETVSAALFETARDIVDCDHCGYHEVDLTLGRSVYIFSSPDIERQLTKDAALWKEFLPTHPVLERFRSAPDTPVMRLSDATDSRTLDRRGLGSALFRTVSTRNQVVLNLGSDPADGSGRDLLPMMIGLPMNRSGSDFDDHDLAILAALQRAARPILRRKRADYLIDLIDRSQLTPSLERNLMGMGLTQRQAEVAFWMLKGKSNTDIGTILDIGDQTVRHHSMAIFARLGAEGRLGLQRRVIRSILKSI